MAKRSRKTRKNNTTPVKSVNQATVVKNTPKERARKTVDFAQEYVYVYGDMRTIAIVTVLMIAVVFGLSFVF